MYQAGPFLMDKTVTVSTLSSLCTALLIYRGIKAQQTHAGSFHAIPFNGSILFIDGTHLKRNFQSARLVRRGAANKIDDFMWQTAQLWKARTLF